MEKGKRLCMYVYIYIYTHNVCIHIYIYIHTHTCCSLSSPRSSPSTLAVGRIRCLLARAENHKTREPPTVCMYVCVYIYIYTHLCIYLYLSLYIYISTYTSYIYIYICSYRVTLICIYIYIHMQQRQISTTTVNDSHGANDESLSGTQEIERGRDSACMMLVKIELHSLRGTKGGPKEGSLNIGRHGVWKCK